MNLAWWTTWLIDWMPFFVLVTVWLVLTAIVRRRTPNNNRLIELVEVQIMEMQRTNALLDRIAVAQEKRAGAHVQTETGTRALPDTLTRMAKHELGLLT